ncbi:MAG: 50S ribosomal protein L9 [Chlamydiia bacterium]
MAQIDLLLIDDVEFLGRTGDLVAVRPGYARNFLVPQKKAVRASKATLRLQVKLRAERQQLAAQDLADAQDLVKRLEGIELKTEVKVDPEGSMYGSVTATDIVQLLAAHSIEVEKRYIALVHPIKELGIHHVPLKLKEGVTAEVLLKVLPEGIDEAQFFGALAEQQEIQTDPAFPGYYARG